VRWKRLKRGRVVVSLLFLATTVLVFLLPGSGVSTWLMTPLVSLQVIPALVKHMTGLGLWTAGLAVVTVLTVLFGRVYCSTICPLGTLQDLVIAYSRRDRRRRWFRYRRPDFLLHYGLLGAIALLFASGSLLLMNLLEPFSNTGRLLEAFARPVMLGLNNAGAFLLGLADVYALVTSPIRPGPAGVILGTLLFMAVVCLMSFRHGRLFCNTLCPAGALLGLVSRLAIFRIVIDRHTCTECKLCEKVCKARCIDSSRQHVDFGACVGCLNCLKACPTVGMRFAGLRWRKRAEVPAQVSWSRRGFLAGSATSVAALVTLPADSAAVRTAFGGIRTMAVTPPGSHSIAHFTSTCTACHLCVSACPTGVIRPAFLEYGLKGIMQPRMDFWTAYCTYDCIQCTTVCPSGALTAIPVEEKHLVQLGKSTFLKEDCVVVSKKKDCGACAEHCPTKAVRMVPYEEKLMIPELNNDLCIGCGACEYPCPTRPRKAIYVTANAVHARAKPPVIEKLEEERATEEFPF